MSQEPRRLRSTAVSLGLVGALALSLSACGSTGASATRRCIDESTLRATDNAYQVVNDPNCVAPSTSSGSGTFGTTPRYRYYYGGTLTSGYVYGGSFTVPTTSSSTRSRTWYKPSTWRSSSSGSSSTSSTSSGSSSTKSGVSTGGFGSSSGGKSGSSSGS